jgi:hypothetical protein
MDKPPGSQARAYEWKPSGSTSSTRRSEAARIRIVVDLEYEAALAAVVTAEGSLLQADVDLAQALVTGLPSGSAKTALQGRLDTVQATIDGAKATLALAEAKAQEAELVPGRYVDYSAVTAALALPETTTAEKNEKAAAILDAIADLVLKAEITGYTPLEQVELSSDQHLLTFADVVASGNLPTTVTLQAGSKSVDATITGWTEFFAYRPVLDATSILQAQWTLPEGYVDDVSPISVYVHVHVEAAQTEPLREVTGYTPLTTVVIDSDNALVDLERLKLYAGLPASVLVTDGIHADVVAQITDWTGTYDAKTIGTTELTAVWTVPAGYVDATPTAITITIDLKVVQPNAAVSILTKTPPTQTVYSVGEELDMSGMVVTVTYADTTELDVAFEDFGTYGITTHQEHYDGDGNLVSITDLNQGDILGADVTEISIMVDGNGTYQPIYVGGLEKPTVLDEVEATSLDVGQSLEFSLLSGTFQDSANQVVDGILSWTEPWTVVDASGYFAWVFTPTDLVAYTPVYGTVRVSVVAWRVPGSVS